MFPFEDVHTRNHESFPMNFRSCPVTIDDTSHLAATLVQEVPADYMTDSIAGSHKMKGTAHGLTCIDSLPTAIRREINQLGGKYM